MNSLSLIDWAICLGYLVVVFALGLWFARGQHSNDDYFLGGRRMHWLPIGLSLFAGTFSSLSFVGLPSSRL
jgi:SSS family solute:Na+ symporter